MIFESEKKNVVGELKEVEVVWPDRVRIIA